MANPARKPKATRVRSLKDLLNELRKKDRALFKYQQLNIDILNSISEGIIYTTLKGKVLFLNNALESIIGLSKVELIGKNIPEIINSILDPQEHDHVADKYEKMISGLKVDSFQVNYKNKILEVTPYLNHKTRHITVTVRDITESVRIHESLAKNETRLRKAEITSKTGNWELHLETGKIVGSEGAALLYGLKNDEYEFERIKKIALPEYRPKMDKALSDLINKNIPYDLEFKIRKADTGEIIDIHSICDYDPERKILFGSIQDITGQKNTQQRLIEVNRDLARLFDISLQLLESIDKNVVIQKIANQAATLLGTDTSAIYLLNDGNLILQATYPPLPDDFPDEFRIARIENHPHIRSVIETGTTSIVADCSKVKWTPEEKQIVTARQLGSMVYIPLFIQKKAAGAIILGTLNRMHKFDQHDIDVFTIYSNITSLALENSYLFDNLIKAKEIAEESNRLKTAFLHNISHEIRTPLNAIVGFSDLITDESVSHADRMEYSSIIRQSNNQLLAIIEDILNISKIETNQVALYESSVDIEYILSNIFNQFKPEASKKGLQFILNNSISGDDAVILTDELKIIGIITNLVSNALKFTHAGKIEIGCRLKNKDLIEFYVSDTGIGIQPEEMDKIFERFYQIETYSSRVYGGMGLGLAISAAYAKILGSRIEVQTVFGKGSVFSFSIPARSVKRQQAKPIQNAVPTNKTILIVEDDDVNYYFIEEAVKKMGFESLRASNGSEAIKSITTNKIDMVLMDVSMPVMNGYDSASEILKLKPETPIIIQTAYGYENDRLKAKEKGCSDFILKPYSFEQLATVILKNIR